MWVLAIPKFLASNLLATLNGWYGKSNTKNKQISDQNPNQFVFSGLQSPRDYRIENVDVSTMNKYVGSHWPE